MHAIEVSGLTKTFYTTKKQPGMGGALKSLFRAEKVPVEAVKDVDIQVAQGEMIGFLGPNGAGKTTTLKMLSGILYPTSGSAKVLGFTPFDRKPEMLSQISLVMGNKNQLWWDLPALDSFRVQRVLYDVSEADFKRRLDELVEALDLADKLNTQVRKLSLGERMKCELVAALLYRPKVLFLDEPTIGLDVVSQQRIREFLRKFHQEEGCTVLLTSHYMQDVQKLCERVVVIDHGTKVFDGTLSELTNRFSESRMLRLEFSEHVDREDLTPYGTLLEFEDNHALIEIPRAETAAITGSVLAKFPVQDVGIQEVELEEIIRRMFTTQPQLESASNH